MSTRVKQAWLYAANLWRHVLNGRRPVTGDIPVVVSLTSYGRRMRTVFLTLETLSAGSARPERLILWVDHQRDLDKVPLSIKKLQRRGLEVRVAGDYRSHKKWYPPLVQDVLGGKPMVIADDDVFYPKEWLLDLWSAHISSPEVVWAHRAQQMIWSKEGFRPYATWHTRRGVSPGNDVFPTGVGGVLYPPGLLELLSVEGEEFMEITPRADDVWLASRAVKHGYLRGQVANEALTLLTIPGSQAAALNRTNISENDVQIAAAFADVDFDFDRPMHSGG